MRHIIKTVLYIFLVIISLTMIFPFFWMILSAMKTKPELEQMLFWPESMRWHQFAEAWTAAPFNTFLWNSIWVTVCTVLLTLLLAGLGGFAFAKYRFRGSRVIFWSILMTMMIPGQVTLIPAYLIAGRLGMVNNYTGLIIPTLPLAFGIFLMRQFMVGIPDDLVDAARIDGSSEIGIFARIIAPLSRPALATLTIFTFIGSWNNFLWPFIILKPDSKWMTLPVALVRYSQYQYSTDHARMMAVATISIIPIIIVYLIFQKAFIQGIAASGLKE